MSNNPVWWPHLDEEVGVARVVDEARNVAVLGGVQAPLHVLKLGLPEQKLQDISAMAVRIIRLRK
jgi:hypothetical protein